MGLPTLEERRTRNFKQCSKCGDVLMESNFPKRCGTPDGLDYWCKLCRKKWRQEHPEQDRRACRRYYATYRDRFRIKNANRKAKLKNVDGLLSVSDWLEVLKKYNGICPSCGEQSDLQIDHVNPFYKGGPNLIENIQPLCQHCNNTKHVMMIRYPAPL